MSRPSFLFGYHVISAERCDVEKIINLCNANAISFSKIELSEDGEGFFTLCIRASQVKKFLKLCSERQIFAESIAKKGLPCLLMRHRRRIGLPLGLLLGALFLIYSSGLIWDIRIDGAREISEREVAETLKECGLFVGAKKSNIDSDVLETHALILSDKISWMSVNISGTVASVEIRELDLPQESEDGDYLYSNVVASENGVIVGFEDITGRISVDIGEAVSENQLLISGLVGDELSSTRIMKASGKVFAEVEEEIEIKIPRKYQKKVSKGIVKEEFFLKFFKNEIKFFSNSRNYPSSCDKIDVIDVSESFYSSNQKKLPFALRRVKYIEYDYLTLSHSDEELKALALRQLALELESRLSDAQILTKSISESATEDCYLLRCKIKCVKNIARINEIELAP